MMYTPSSVEDIVNHFNEQEEAIASTIKTAAKMHRRQFSEMNQMISASMSRLALPIEVASAAQRSLAKPLAQAVIEFQALNHEIKRITGPLKEIQQHWIQLAKALSLNNAAFIPPTKNQTTLRLIRIQNGEVLVEFKGKKFRKSDSIHLLILKALLFESNEEGFLSYNDIELYLLKNGKKQLQEHKKRRKRILNAIPEIFRALEIPKIHEGHRLIERIEGKGLKLSNPTINGT